MSIQVGLHLHQFPAQFEDKLMACRRRSFTVLDLDAGYYVPKLDAPGALWTIRLYHPDHPGREPEEIAGAIIVEAEKWRQRLGDRVIYQAYNEINLGIEWGGNHGIQSWLDSDEGFVKRAEKHLRLAKDLKRRAPWIKQAGPWDSPGHQDIDGREEVKRLADMGYFDLLDAFGGHYYAEGIDRGGFDATDREWYADRVLKVRKVLDDEGYEHLPIIIGECNRKDTDQGHLWAEYERYLRRIDGAVERVDWFIWSSPDASFGSMQLWKAPDPVNNFNRLSDMFAGSTPPPEPVEPPHPEERPPSDAVADIAKQFGLVVHNGTLIEVKALTVRGDPPNIEANGPSDRVVRVATKDEQHKHESFGHAELSFGQPAVYYPLLGQTGFYYATCGDARVDGLGWAFGLPTDMGAHTNIVTTFAVREKPIEPPVPPVIPIESPYVPEGAFAGAYQDHWGEATSPAFYAMIDPRPPEMRQSSQFFQNGVAIWTGSHVVFTRRGT